MRGGVQSEGRGGDRSTAEHTAEPVDQRVIAAIPSQGPDHAGEGRERIRTTGVLRAVRYLPRDHCRAERSLSTVVGRLNAWIIQETQQVALMGGVSPLSGLEPVLFRQRVHRLTVYTLFEDTSGNVAQHT